MTPRCDDADEVDQVLHFGAGQRSVLLDLLQRAASCSASTAAGSGTTASASSMTSGVKPRRIEADVFTPKMRAGRLPTVRANGSASLVTTE